MSEPQRLYCCVEHRDQNASSMGLIDYLSKAYMEALKIQIKQLKAMRECRSNQTDFSALSPLGANETKRIENMLVTCDRLLKQFNEQLTGSSSQHGKTATNEIIRESLILKSDIDYSVSIGDNIEISIFNEEELLRSPVLMNRQAKPRKNLPATIISDSTITSEKDESHTSQTLLARTDEKQTKTNNISPLEGDDKFSMSVLNSTANNDVIECTPVQKSYKKMCVSKLYHIDTSISENGKKLRQAKLAFEPFKENVDISICQKNLMVKPVSKKENLLETTDQNQTNVDEIIENSPQRSQIFSIVKSRSKSIQERKPSRHKIGELFCTNREDSLRRQFKDKENAPLKETTVTDFSQFSPLLSSTQYDPGATTGKPYSISLLSHSNKSTALMQQKRDILSLTSEIKKTEASNVNIHPSKRKLSDFDDSDVNDETYFDPIKINGKDQQKQDVTVSKTISSAKRNLLTNYDRPWPIAKKEDKSSKPGRTREERAKLEGIDCWECEQYYKSVGLTGSQMKSRMKTCSRHRNKCGVRQNTPEGFWDEGFPDTQSSSIGD